MKSKSTTVLLNWVILLVLVLIWGSSFILMKRGLEHFSAEQVALQRISITFLFLLPFAIYSIRKIPFSKLGLMFIVGMIGNAIPAFLFAKAQTGIDSSLAGILNSITPLFALVIGLIFFKNRPKWYNVMGVFIGLAGTIGLMSVSGGRSLEFNFGYGMYIIIATLLYAINLNVVKTYLSDVNPVAITSLAFTIIGIPALIYMLAMTDFVHIVNTQPGAWTGIGYIAILAVFGTAIALFLYYKLIKTSGVLFAASVTYVMPVVAVFWGIADGEKFEAIYVLWILIILSGVFLVSYTFGKTAINNK